MRALRTPHHLPGPVRCYQEPLWAHGEQWEMQSHPFSCRCEKAFGTYHRFKLKFSGAFLKSRHVSKSMTRLEKASQQSGGNCVLGHTFKRRLLKETRWLNWVPFTGVSIAAGYSVVLRREGGGYLSLDTILDTTPRCLAKRTEHAELPMAWVARRHHVNWGSSEAARGAELQAH